MKEWVSTEVRQPNKTGLYDVKTIYGEFEAFVSTTASGKLVWVVPDSLTILYWKEKS